LDLIKRALGWFGLGVVAAALAAAGYWLLFSTFKVYDDEGYVLISLRNYGAHGALYDQVFSQYGPFFFALYDLVHGVLGFAWTHTNGRMLTWALWWGTAAICAALVWRRTRSTGASVLTLAGVFSYLWVMVQEPTHPGGLIAILVALAAWLGIEFDPARSPMGAGILGAVGAALALVKINVGGFLLTSLGLWFLLHASSPRVRRAGGWIAAAWLVLLPWLLMRPLLSEPWVWRFALVSTLASTSAFAASRQGAETVAGRRVTIACLVGGLALASATVAYTLGLGTTVRGLLHGVVLDALHHPFVYNFPFRWRPGSEIVAALGVLVVLGACQWPESLWVKRLVIAARLLAMTALVLAALQCIPISVAALGMTYGVALAGICALPLRQDPAGLDDARARRWLALLLVLQFLHAYPVAGSQLNWGTFLWVPLIVLAVRDAWQALPPIAALSFVPRCGAVAAFAVSGIVAGGLCHAAFANRNKGEPLDLPGAESIIVPDQTVFGLRIMEENARVHANMVYSLPGLYSFNLWTGLPTPTAANATQWFNSLSEFQQQAIIARLQHEPRAVLIVQPDILRFLVYSGFHAAGPLADYLSRDFHCVFDVDGYAFWVHRGRAVAPLSTGKLTRAAGATAFDQLDLYLMAPIRPIARIELWALTPSERHYFLTLSAANATLAITPLNQNGDAISDPLTSSWSDPLPTGIVRTRITWHNDSEWPDQVAAFVFDSKGRRLAAARVLR
jgi:hypothetical protein